MFKQHLFSYMYSMFGGGGGYMYMYMYMYIKCRYTYSCNNLALYCVIINISCNVLISFDI